MSRFCPCCGRPPNECLKRENDRLTRELQAANERINGLDVNAFGVCASYLRIQVALRNAGFDVFADCAGEPASATYVSGKLRNATEARLKEALAVSAINRAVLQAAYKERERLSLTLDAARIVLAYPVEHLAICTGVTKFDCDCGLSDALDALEQTKETGNG